MPFLFKASSISECNKGVKYKPHLPFEFRGEEYNRCVRNRCSRYRNFHCLECLDLEVAFRPVTVCARASAEAMCLIFALLCVLGCSES